MPVSVKTAPPVEPVTLEEARSHLRLVASGSPASHPDDDFIESAIQGAREHAENFMRRTIIETEFEWSLDDFPSNNGALTLPRNPVLSVSEVAYTDTGGASQTFSDYTESFSDFESILVPGYDKNWPDTRAHTGDVTVMFKAGYPKDDSPTDYRANVPAAIKRAILLLVGHFYENREAVVIGASVAELPMATKSLLYPYRVLDV